MIDRIAPNSLLAEQQVIGCILDDPDKALQVLPILEAEDFHERTHKSLYLAITEITKLKNEPTSTAIRGWLETHHVSYEDYLLEALMEQGGIDSQLTSNCRIIKEKSTSRKVINILKRKIDHCYSDQEDVQKLMDGIQTSLYNTSIDLSNKTKDNLVSTSSEWVPACAEATEEAHKNPGQKQKAMITSHYHMLEDLTGGARDINLISAFTGCGKTTLALNLAVNYGVTQRIPTLYLNYEMEELLLSRRILSIVSGKAFKAIEKGVYERPSDYVEVQEALTKLNGCPLHTTHNQSKDLGTSVALVEKYVISHGIKVLFVDYVGDIAGDEQSMKENEYVSWGRYLQTFKDVCVKHGIKMWFLAQEGRGDTGIQGSIKLVQKADIHIVLSKSSDGSRTFLELKKNRNGPAKIRWEVPVGSHNFRMHNNWRVINAK